MALMLDEIPEFVGPLESFPSPFPVPELGTSITLLSNNLYQILSSNLNTLLSSLQAIQQDESRVSNTFELGHSELEQARIALEQVNLAVELQDLLIAEGNFGVADAELQELESLNPGNITISPVTVTTPEIDYIEGWYTTSRYWWDVAWPLWPYAPPG